VPVVEKASREINYTAIAVVITVMLSESERKEKFFNRLFEQLKVNEKHQVSQESLLLEMYLALYANDFSNPQFKNFIDILKEETDDFLLIKLCALRTSDTFKHGMDFILRRETFKRLFSTTKVLYDILRTSLSLEQNKFLEKYSYLNLNETALKVVKTAASFLKKEDYFWVRIVQLGYLQKVDWILYHKAIFEIASFYQIDPANQNVSLDHNLLISIEDNVKECKLKLTGELKSLILPILKEYFASDNPFKKNQLSLKQKAAEVSPAPLSADLLSPIAVLKESKHYDNEILGAAEISPIGFVDPLCVQMIRDQLSKFKKQDLSTSSDLSNDIRLPAKSRRPSKGGLKNSDSVTALTEILKAVNISPRDALLFFENKRKLLATKEVQSYVKFSSFCEDELVAKNGFRSYSAKTSTNNNKILVAGFCTCMVHAIRLLCLCETALSTDKQLQNVLKIMVKDMKTKTWEVEEVILGLKLELAAVSFQLLAHSFSDIIKQTKYLGELSLAGISSRQQLIEEVKHLYNANAAKDIAILFISFDDKSTAKEGVELPYVFCFSPEGEGHDNGKFINFADDDTDPSNFQTFQTVGMIYSFSEKNRQTLHTFQFITFSRCNEDGQYQVYENFPCNAEVLVVHKVAHSKEDSEPSKTLQLKLESGHSLVGLILVRNSNQNSAEHPFLQPETIRSFSNPTSSGDPCLLTCKNLQKLNNVDAWLDDELVHAMTHIMFRSLLSKHGESTTKIALRSCHAFKTQFERSHTNRKRLTDLISTNQYIIFIVNVGNSHWICICIAMVWKKIFSLDSLYNKDYCAGKVELVIQYLRTHHSVELKWVHLKSPRQKDSVSCGIFCAMNATFFLKSILEGSFTAEGPGDKDWSTKNFCEQDKVSIRENLKEVIYGDQDGSSLLRWIK